MRAAEGLFMPKHIVINTPLVNKTLAKNCMLSAGIQIHNLPN